MRSYYKTHTYISVRVDRDDEREREIKNHYFSFLLLFISRFAVTYGIVRLPTRWTKLRESLLYICICEASQKFFRNQCLERERERIVVCGWRYVKVGVTAIHLPAFVQTTDRTLISFTITPDYPISLLFCVSPGVFSINNSRNLQRWEITSVSLIFFMYRSSSSSSWLTVKNNVYSSIKSIRIILSVILPWLTVKTSNNQWFPRVYRQQGYWRIWRIRSFVMLIYRAFITFAGIRIVSANYSRKNVAATILSVQGMPLLSN